MPGGRSRKAHPYLIPLSLAILATAGLIPYPDARSPATDGTVANAIEEGRRWDRTAPAESITLRIDQGAARTSRVTPDLLVKEPEEGPGTPASPSVRRNMLRAIEAALIREHAIESGVVTITAARDGSVALTGDVQTPQEKRRAGEVARAVRDVAFVDNRLSVTSAAERPDPAIGRDIEERLAQDAKIDPSFIRIAVANGVVTLTGAVGTAAEKRRAVEDAWVAGVRHVEASRLNVRDWAQRFKRTGDKWSADSGMPEETALQRAELVPPSTRLRNFLE